MDRNVRYEVLSTEEENVPAEPVVLAMVVPPPEYEESNGNAQNTEECFGTKLPTYVEATTLPSYEEAQRFKAEEAAMQEEVDRQRDEEHGRFTELAIGTDSMFLCTFIMSFVFNWIGFLFSLCVTQTVAGRCGALSGLGLSIVKWVALFKHNQWVEGFAEKDSWVWWLLIFCGFMIFVRGAVQYARVKFEWHKFSGQIRRYYLF